jgi:hypothetical protein
MRSQLGSAFGDSETMHDLRNPKNYTFNLTGRLRSGLTIETAKPADLERFFSVFNFTQRAQVAV